MRRTTLDATSFGSLFLILTIVVAGSGRSVPSGLMVWLPRAEPCLDEDIVVRPIIVDVLSNDEVTIDDECVEHGKLGKQLHAIFATRNQRIVFVTADVNLTVQNVAEVLDIAQAETDHVILVTPLQEEQWDRGSCTRISDGANVIRSFYARHLLPVPLPPWMDQSARSNCLPRGRSRP